MYIHVIQSGETVWQIAQNYDSSVNQIMLINDLKDPNRLVIGQAIVIPEREKEYVVESGDTLSQIARMYRVDLVDLAAANQIVNPALIFTGEYLRIPYLFYTVQFGDSLWTIANRYGVTIEQIIGANEIENPNLIYPGQILFIPLLASRTIETNAYIRPAGEWSQFNVRHLGRFLTYIAPFMYRIQEDGNVTQTDDTALIEASYVTETLPLLTLTNLDNDELFDSDLAATVLRDEAVQDVLITNLIEIMRDKRYAGVNVNFEYVYPDDRENYNQFLRRLVTRLHPEGFLVSTALAPKERSDQPGTLYEAHDYEAQAEIVDFIVVMTYEWGWAGGRPLAIAPINKVRDVLDYAVKVIPPEKIMMGIPLYGRDWQIPWVAGTRARTVSPEEALTLARTYGATILYDDTYQAPYFYYVDEMSQMHEVWFEDARSMQAKYELIEEYGLRGASYWLLGMPFPQNWPLLQANFNVSK